MHLECLPDSTRAALERVQAVPAISKYILIGGTALALQVGHRISEDLDFVTLSGQIDRDEIKSIIDDVSGGAVPKLVTPMAAREDMENAGLDIDDSHQDWLVDGVKITFFATDKVAQRAVYEQTKTHRLGNVQILDEAGIFRLKSMVIMDRRTSRDLFDLWFFIDKRGRSVEDVLSAMDDRKHHRNLDDILQMLAPTSIPLRDPGFATSLPEAPNTTEELLSRMRYLAATHRREVAAQEIRAFSKGPNDVAAGLGTVKDVGHGR